MPSWALFLSWRISYPVISPNLLTYHLGFKCESRALTRWHSFRFLYLFASHNAVFVCFQGVLFVVVQLPGSVRLFVPRGLQHAQPPCHGLPEFAQFHVHWASDAIQPSHSQQVPPYSTFYFSYLKICLFEFNTFLITHMWNTMKRVHCRGRSLRKGTALFLFVFYVAHGRCLGSSRCLNYHWLFWAVKRWHQ